ncbi:hypothetical protein AAFF_G00056420 [Aldrovandia affinis]|uniref:Reverse transcriptase domain-containing protein n=1 Tax=Aldrovandia affinis TaxID=143900 RepID=A0AAD7R2H1_9TELE|nr:hypothetical protein AAFF_G00056420 [Aldrovandia affinis]
MYVRRKLLEEGPGLTLARTLQLASQCESVEEQMSAMSGAAKAETETVHRVAQKGGETGKNQRKPATKVSSASEQYQHEVANALAGIEGVENISDDIIVHAQDQDTHDKASHAVLTRLMERGLTLNPDKCQFNMDKLVFMGILLSEKGIGPTEERVRAVAEAREPENAAEVRSFLGLVGYSSRFIPQFATLWSAAASHERIHLRVSDQSREERSMRSRMNWPEPAL